MVDFGSCFILFAVCGFLHHHFCTIILTPNMAIKNCSGGYFWIADRIWNPGIGPDLKITWAPLSTHFWAFLSGKNVKYGQKNGFFAFETHPEFVLNAGISVGSSLGWMSTFYKNRIQIGGAEKWGSKKNFQMLLAIPYCVHIPLGLLMHTRRLCSSCYGRIVVHVLV